MMNQTSLVALAEDYVAALTAHDPARLPLAPDARFTENTIELPLGKGLWRTLSRYREPWLVITDPVQGEVLHVATIEENARPAILVLRLQVQAGVITQIETMVIRDPKASANLGRLDPVFLAEVPTIARTPRATMVRLADRYFDAVEISDATGLTFDPRCKRRENGSQSTSNPGRTEHFFTSSFHGYALSCEEQFATRMWSFIEQIHSRRYLVMDEQRGLLACWVTFMHPAVVTSFVSPSGEPIGMPPYAETPNTFQIAEIFKFEDGAFRAIEVFGIALPYGNKCGW